MENTFLRDEQFKRYQLGKCLGWGGNGKIYEIAGAPNLVVKYFKKPTKTLENKIGFLITYPPRFVSSPDKGSHTFWAWPQKLVYTAESRFVGYVMPKARGQSGDDFMQMDSRNSWKSRLNIATLLTKLVHSTYDSNYLIGNFNSRNIIINEQDFPTIIDIDSFQITNKITGQVLFPCTVADPEYSPPEVQLSRQARAYRKIEGDYFSLSIYIFQLLMLGLHPFVDTSAKGKNIPANIKAGNFVLSTKSITLLKAMPSLSVLSPEIHKLFIRTFQEGHFNPQQRPNAKEWLEALNNVSSGLLTCTKNDRHFYSNHQKKCPWCQYLKKNKLDPFTEENGLNFTTPKPALLQTKATVEPNTEGNSSTANYSSSNIGPKLFANPITSTSNMDNNRDEDSDLITLPIKHKSKLGNESHSPKARLKRPLSSILKSIVTLFFILLFSGISSYFYLARETNPLPKNEIFILNVWEDYNANGERDSKEPSFTKLEPTLFKNEVKVTKLCYKKTFYGLCQNDVELFGDGYIIHFELPETNKYIVTTGDNLNATNVTTNEFSLQQGSTLTTDVSSSQTGFNSTPIVELVELVEPIEPIRSHTHNIGIAKYANLEGEICLDYNDDEECDKNTEDKLASLELKFEIKDGDKQELQGIQINESGSFMLDSLLPGQVIVAWKPPEGYSLSINPAESSSNIKTTRTTLTEVSTETDLKSGESKNIGTIILKPQEEQLRKEQLERERLAKLERERLAKLERERLAKLERERLAEQSFFNISGRVCFTSRNNYSCRSDVGGQYFQNIKVSLYKTDNGDVYKAEYSLSTNGNYSFGNLEPGSYKVILKEVIPIGYPIFNNRYIYPVVIRNDDESISFSYYID